MGLELVVERAPGSEACADVASVFDALQRLFPERRFRRSVEASKSNASVRVMIRPTTVGHEAAVTVLEPRRAERVIREKDVDCNGLADALAVALVLLIEEPQSPTTSTPSEPDRASAPAATKPPPTSSAQPHSLERRDFEPPASAPRHSPQFRADVEAFGVGGVGLLSEPALGAAVGLELAHQSGWGVSLQGTRLWAQPSQVEDGSVTLSLWAVSLGPCYRASLSVMAAVDGCLRLGAGAQYADVSGFSASRSGSFPWMVLAPTLGYRQSIAEAILGFVRVGPVLQLLPQSFSVREGDAPGDTSRVAAAPKVGVVAELGLALSARLF